MTEEKKKMLNRLCRIEGRVHETQKMIDEEKKRIDAVTQLNAIRSSTGHVMRMIVAKNLKHCFENPEKDPKEQEERLAQVINMIVKK